MSGSSVNQIIPMRIKIVKAKKGAVSHIGKTSTILIVFFKGIVSIIRHHTCKNRYPRKRKESNYQFDRSSSLQSD